MADARANSNVTARQRVDDILKRLPQANDIEELLHEVIDNAINVAGADKDTSRRFDERDDCLKIVVSRGFSNHFCRVLDAP